MWVLLSQERNSADKVTSDFSLLEEAAASGFTLYLTCLSIAVGLPDYELKTGGNEIDVTAKNAGEYVAAVIEATLSKGIQRQMESFR